MTTPKTNWQFQSLHNKNSDIDWKSIGLVERDICFLYHQLAEYSYIMPDFDYFSFYTISYWNYLSLIHPHIKPQQASFIRCGCLVMILCMACDIIDGSGTNQLAQNLDECHQRLLEVKCENEDESKLLKTVLIALEILKNKKPESEELGNLANWVHIKFVRGYFKEKTENFHANPYYG